MGTGSAYEREYEEGGEWETETEKGGEVELEQFWLQKTFCRALNLRFGHIVVPVGLNNSHHEPLNFFTVYRPEGENTILPSTWHQTGVSLWGYLGKFKYEVQFLEGLDAMHFDRDGWIHNGTHSAFEFDPARACYEKSEAFLLGAASDYDIDPHIDSWPLDLTALHTELLNSKQIARYSSDDEDANIDNIHGDLNQFLLGFHAVEFVVFRYGEPRKVTSFNSTYDDYNDRADFTDIKPIDELNFAVAVAGDLMGSIYELEVCWSGKTADHKTWLENHEWHTTMPSSDITYGENMKNAGKAGSIYTSVKSAVSALLIGDQGCGGICDEVGQTKMGKPYGLNTTEENAESDPNYIESPFSYNSLTDFWDNIQSIKNIWFGGYSTDNTKTGTYSFHNYFAKLNPTLGAEVEAAITEAQAKIKACPAPFVNNYKNAQVKAAIDACTALSNELTKANDYIQSQTK